MSEVVKSTVVYSQTYAVGFDFVLTINEGAKDVETPYFTLTSLCGSISGSKTHFQKIMLVFKAATGDSQQKISHVEPS